MNESIRNRLLALMLDEISQARISRALDKRDETDKRKQDRIKDLTHKSNYYTEHGKKGKAKRADKKRKGIEKKVYKSDKQISRVVGMARDRTGSPGGM